ncbi:hypothetical protein [Constantimarinum furrinae]|uniref:hypothetical protein n=1 Tax=Constantimarinum furrinae TaxID=2562285 RepID=UPI00164BD560|nr:hypothetical protein [Constantimarinum furrinae]
MSKTIKFLSELDDYELAYFAKFKLDTYLPETQYEIKRYLIQRNLNNHRIDELIKVNPKKKSTKNRLRCTRCSSDKIRVEKVAWTDTSDKIGYADEIAVLDGLGGKETFREQIICNVCEFWIKDPNNEKSKKSIWHHIGDFIFTLFSH